MKDKEQLRKEIKACQTLFLSGREHVAKKEITRIRDEASKELHNIMAVLENCKVKSDLPDEEDTRNTFVFCGLLARYLSYIVYHFDYDNDEFEERIKKSDYNASNEAAILRHFDNVLSLFDKDF